MTELHSGVEEPASGELQMPYEDLFRLAPISYLVTDSAGMIREANRAAGELLGVGNAYLLGKPITIFVPAENRRQFRRTLLGLAHTSTEAEWQLELETRGGSRFHAQVNAARSEDTLRWTIQDVSERVRNEHRLRTLASVLEERVLERTDELEQERARLAAIVDQMPGGLVVVDAASGRVVTANEQAYALLGTIDEVPSLSADTPVRRALAGDAVDSELFEYDKPDGSRGLLNVSAAPIRDRAGRVTAAVSIFEDVTESEVRDRAEREFVTNAAHELQTPIAAIMSAVEVLQAGAKDTQDRDLFIGHIERQSGRLARLTGALLTLARAQTGVEEPRTELIDLRATLEAVAGRMEPAENVSLAVECPPDLALVANRELLEQLVSNVVRNAVKFTEGGSIRIVGELRDGAVRIRVVDTGVGISNETLPSVTERFYRGDAPGEGFGLGLAIVESALEVMGGQLQVDSEGLGHGTTVTLTLPLGAIQVPH